MKRARRWILAALAASLSLGIGAPAEALIPNAEPRLAAIEAYLDGLRYFRARFTQTGPRGETATGVIYLWRPGRMRVDYDPPSRILLIAEDWRLIYYDGSIRQVNTIPLSKTPLAFLLADRIRLGGRIAVLAFEEEGGRLYLTLADRDRPDQGRVTLEFSAEPLRLLGWTVRDAQNRDTRVELETLETGFALDPELFHWRDPAIFGYPDD